jgi:hypothetical protein
VLRSVGHWARPCPSSAPSQQDGIRPLSAVSVLQVSDALRSVFTSTEAKERLQEAMASSAVKFNLKEVIDIVRSPTFFEELGAHLDALLPTIEAIIVMQGGSVTLADGMFCFGRQLQFLTFAGEFAVLDMLEKRFSRLEKPLFIPALVFHPMYAKVGRAMIDAAVVNIMMLTDWINTYCDRWGHGAAADAVSAALAIQEWSSGLDGWVTHTSAFGGEAGKYWNFILSSSPATSPLPSVNSRRLLAQVAKQLLGALPNSADLERFFRVGSNDHAVADEPGGLPESKNAVHCS